MGSVVFFAEIGGGPEEEEEEEDAIACAVLNCLLHEKGLILKEGEIWTFLPCVNHLGSSRRVT